MFAEHGAGLKLRSYQSNVAYAIVDSVVHRRGHTIVVIFPRQSGKNELQAQVEAYLLALFQNLDKEMVKVSPTWKPQSLNAMRRLERTLSRNIITDSAWVKESGYIYNVGTTRIAFLSGLPASNIVGATASLLLECDEAQEVNIEKWDKEINPMAASTNATKVFWGTAWTSQTLLSREKRTALEAQKKDGIQRVFHINADLVGKEVPSYRKFVDGEIAKLGRNHPFIKTQFFSEEIDAEAGMFPPARLALMQGKHTPHVSPQPGEIYAFTIDVGGEDLPDEFSTSIYSKRDSTSLTIYRVDPSTLADPLIRAPSYFTVNRSVWTGVPHHQLYGQLKALIDLWEPARVVIDATGVGEGLSSFLYKAYPEKVIPFIFTSKSKSDLAWSFIAVIESGRYKEHSSLPQDTPIRTPSSATVLQSLFWKQCLNAQLEILPGPGKTCKWSVPDGTRDIETGELIHDDLLISAAMVSQLDGVTGLGTAESTIIEAYDPLKDMSF